jgi:hemin uptake protein HemP
VTSRYSPDLQPHPLRRSDRASDGARHMPDPVRVFTSAELFAGATEIAIEHQGARYRLKITRQGKLILNK